MDVSNKFNSLKEAELENREEVAEEVECRLAAQVVKKVSNKKSKGFKMQKIGGEKKLLLVRESKKPLVLVKSNDQFMSALLDTGSDRSLINYRNVKCLPTDSIKESNVRVKGLKVGKVELELQTRCRPSKGRRCIPDVVI